MLSDSPANKGDWFTLPHQRFAVSLSASAKSLILQALMTCHPQHRLRVAKSLYALNGALSSPNGARMVP
jgi:hypothetical protein